MAMPGYGVGAIAVAGGGGLDSFKLTFMKIDGKGLDPNDTYSSEKIGGPGGGSPYVFGGDGTPIVGILGRVSDDKKSMGLGAVFLSPTPTSISKRAGK
jgi:hypothetical protein